jgi:hypothetical protein
MTGVIATIPRQQFLDALGVPLIGGKLYVYQAGSTTPADTFQDQGLTAKNPNPVPLDAAGSCAIWLDPTAQYKFVLRNALGVTQPGWPIDNVSGASNVLSLAPTFSLYAKLSALALAAGSSLLGFVHTSAVAIKTSVQAKLQERPSLLDFMTDAQRADVLSNTGSLDVTAAVQAALDAYVDPEAPAGTYGLSQPLVVTSSLTLKGKKRKTIFKALSNFTAGTVTRTYVDSTGATQTLTWNDKAVFYLVCPTNSYLIDFQLDGMTFTLPDDGSVGVFNAQRVAHSSVSDVYVNTSAYFVKGYDLWMWRWSGIRSRFSKDHFDINTGTSHTFENVHCDQKYGSGGIGYTLTNMRYVEMHACGADSLDRCYYFDNSTVVMAGCGAESFSRILQAKNGANVTVSGGDLAIYKAASATSTFYPYQFSDAGTKVTIDGTWLGVRNPAAAGGTYAQMIIEGGAELVAENMRYPVEIGSATSWWSVTGASVLTLLDKNGARYISAYGPSRLDGVTNLKSFEYTKTIAAGSAQSILRMPATVSGGGYGDSCWGKIELYLFNDYNPDFGFCGHQLYSFSAFNETTKSQNLTKLGDSITPTNSGGATLGVLTATLVRNGDNTIDLQLAIPSAFGATKVIAVVSYMNQYGGNQTALAITGV